MYMETHPELYEDHTQSIVQNQEQPQYADVAAHEEVEVAEEIEIEVEPEENQVVERSEVQSEFEYDPEEVDYDPEETDPEYNEGPEDEEAQIKEEPHSEDGYEQDQETDGESAEERAEASPQRRVVLRDAAQGARNKRRAKREKIRRDQATKPAHTRLGRRPARERLGSGVAGRTRRRTPTPSTEINSDQNKAIPVSPRTTDMIDRNNRNFLRDLRKARSRVKVLDREEEEIEEPSDSDYDDEQDNKMSRNKKHHRQ